MPIPRKGRAPISKGATGKNATPGPSSNPGSTRRNSRRPLSHRLIRLRRNPKRRRAACYAAQDAAQP